MDSLTNIFTSILQGLFDSIKGTTVVFYLDKEINKKLLAKQKTTSQNNLSSFTNKRDINAPKREEESKVLKRVLQCCALNGGVFWASIMVFEYGLLPGLKLLLSQLGQNSMVWSWVQPILSLLFGMIWVLPLFLLSKVVNGLWFQDIADSAYKFRKGRPQLIPSFSRLIADILFNLLVQALFLVQSMLVNLLPIQYLGTILCFVHMCLLYSLYSFEYKWINMGWELHRRLTHIEQNWPYFLGFGLPLALTTQMPNSYIVSGCVFSILFPLFILSANEASPVVGCGDVHMKMFSPVVAISNSLFNCTLKNKSRSPALQKQSSISSQSRQSTPVPSSSRASSFTSRR